MEAFDRELARKTVKNYACSNCWGELELRPDLREADKYFVVCKKCQDDTRGYVTQYFVNTRRSASEFEKRDVTRLLQSIGVIQKPQRTQAEIMNSMGF
jgi:DNA-directed RNA polymerase subunit RPC12/RpoP